MGLNIQTDVAEQAVLDAAFKIANAARTAPKAAAKDYLVIAVADKSETEKIADHMNEMVKQGDAANFFLRDAGNLRNAHAVLIIGTKIAAHGLALCSLCGFSGCDEKNEYENVPCAFNTHDLGLAVGSAVSMAADLRLDNRVMFSVGKAAIDMGLLGDDVKIAMGIPLAAAGKNPFFDRK